MVLLNIQTQADKNIMKPEMTQLTDKILMLPSFFVQKLYKHNEAKIENDLGEYGVTREEWDYCYDKALELRQEALTKKNLLTLGRKEINDLEKMAKGIFYSGVLINKAINLEDNLKIKNLLQRLKDETCTYDMLITIGDYICDLRNASKQ
jgi:hypothetical protein